MLDSGIEATTIQPAKPSESTLKRPDVSTKPTIALEDALTIFEGTDRFIPLSRFASPEDSRQFMSQAIVRLAAQQPISHETQAAQLGGKKEIESIVETAKNTGEVEQLAHIFLGEQILQQKLIGSKNITPEEQQAMQYQLGRMALTLEISYNNKQLRLMAKDPKNPKLVKEGNRSRLFTAAYNSLSGFDSKAT